MSRPFPLPSDVETRKRPRDYLYRAGAAYIRSRVAHTLPELCAKQMFGDDVVTALVVRAASSTATTSSPSWAGAIAQAAVDDSVMAIATLSAAAGLIQRGMKIDFARRASIRVPGRIVDATDAGQWVGEGKPIVVRSQRMTSGPTLTPHKLVLITSFSREMAESSAIEAVSRALISEASALALDAAMFAAASVTDAPPSILGGITPITAATGGGLSALTSDMKALTAALVAAGAGREPIIIASPMQATSIKLLTTTKFDVPVLASNALAAGTAIMLEPSTFVSAFDTVPEFDVVNAPAFHYEDTAPADPLMSGQPVRSLFQIDSIGLRMTLRAAWGMRAPHVAYLTGATW
jgi:HK97 family phage major capsid protein